jgi:putative FmdB family regulatory protein
MPIYEFRCMDCGRVLEALRRLGQGAEGLCCPHCGGEQLEKVFSAFASGSSSAPRGPATGGCGNSGFG